MDDRTLLELAAKACGYTLVENYDMHGKYWPWCNELADNWSPLDVDGDALSLAVKLRLDCMFDLPGFDGMVVTYRIGDTYFSVQELYNDDPYAATRRAITRAAAAVGEAMP